MGRLGDKSKFRVGLLNKEHFGNRLVEIGNNHITILYPYDYLDDISKVENLEKRFSMYTEFDGNLGKLLQHLLYIFAEISANSPDVSVQSAISVFKFTWIMFYINFN